ncbi:MAG: hypothetical protein ACOCW2_01250 [Chitinivibrionales bacterium]
MDTFSLSLFVICVLFSTALMILFVLINIPYYRMCYGQKTTSIVMRTIGLNFLAILLGWFPVIYLWPQFSRQILLPLAGIVGALGCVGSRFIYHEIIPEELAKRLIELVEQKKMGEKQDDKR